MLSSLMVPLDGSALARHGLPLAVDVARRTGARLHLVQVHEAPSPGPLRTGPAEPVLARDDDTRRVATRDSGQRGAEERAREDAELTLLADRLSAEEDLGVTTALLDGPVTPALAAYAAEEGIDMVVMTTHGRSGLRRVLLGSVADELIRSSTLPVILVRPEEGPSTEGEWSTEGEPPPGAERPEEGERRVGGAVRHLLVPLDGSTVAEGVLGPVCELARTLDAHMTLTNVVSIESVFGPRPVQLLRYRSERRWARAYLDAVAERIGSSVPRVTTHVTLGRAPAPTIAEIADELDADLIALATRGLRGVRRVVQGSVAEQLLRHGRRPLLVVRGA